MQPIVVRDSMRQGGRTEMEPGVIADIVRSRVGDRTFQHWFEGRTTFSVENDCLRISVASPFLVTWMQKQLRVPLQESATEILGPSGWFDLQVDTVLAQQKQKEAKEHTAEITPAINAKRTEASGALSGARRFAKLEDFVTGDSNQLPFVAAKQVAAAPGQKYNPFFVHGSAGTGKSHLLEGIYCDVRRQFPDSQVLYLTSEAFMNYFTQAQRERAMPGFRQRFRNVDVLILDDIDFFDAKRGTQEELLHTITQLQSHGRQVIVSAHCHPRMLTNLRDELTTRFMAGLVCRLETPDESVRLKFAERKARELSGEFTADALKFVAGKFSSSLRELEGAMNCLDTHFAATQERVTLTVARRVLGALERDYQRIVSITDIEKAVAKTFGVTAKELRSSSRERRISRPRMLAMYLARLHTQAAYQEIGRHFGNRNHSTVMSAERKVKGWIEDGTELRLASQVWNASDLVSMLEDRLLAG
ncbi:MAG: chromosomal replication initiator protein DnaA [Planctomycetaceae bacterium]